MGAHEADVSRNVYDETKRYQQLVSQQGKPWVAADDNDGQQIIYNLIRRFIQLYWGDGSPNDGFKIVGDGSDNDFIITGGDGTIKGAGRMNLAGFQCFLPSDRNYAATGNLECTPVSTALSGTMLSDSAANFTLGGADDNLVGRTLIPDITQPGYSYSIIANTQTTITITGPIDTGQITIGSHYRVDLSTPAGSDRTDEVYLDCYLDEISGDEDPDLKHTLAIQIETCRRLKLIQNVLVAEGGTTPANYTDVDGNQHCTMKLATLQRYDGQAAINPGDLTDERPLTDSFRNMWMEMVTARGSMASLDNRLDVALNENGALIGSHLLSVLLGVDGAGTGLDADLLDGTELSAIRSEIDSDVAAHAAVGSAHHTRYNDSEATAAMGTKDDANPLNHDRYSDSEARAITGWGHSNVVTGLNADLLDGKHVSDIYSDFLLLATYKGLTVQNHTTNYDYMTTITANALALSKVSGGGPDRILLESINEDIDLTLSGAGGLDSGSEAIDTTYAVWTIYNPTTQITKGLFSSSFTNPVMPSGYTYRKLTGLVRNNNSGDLVRFHQVDNTLLYDYNFNLKILSNGSARSYADVDTSAYTGNNIICKTAILGFNAQGWDASANWYYNVRVKGNVYEKRIAWLRLGTNSVTGESGEFFLTLDSNQVFEYMISGPGSPSIEPLISFWVHGCTLSI